MPAFMGLGWGFSPPSPSLLPSLPSSIFSLLFPSLSHSFIFIHIHSYSLSICSSPSLSLSPVLPHPSPHEPSSFSPSFLPPFFLCFIFSPLFSGNRNRVVILVSSSPFKRLQLWRWQQQVALPWRLYCMAKAGAAAARIPQTMPRQVQVSRPFPCTFSF